MLNCSAGALCLTPIVSWRIINQNVRKTAICPCSAWSCLVAWSRISRQKHDKASPALQDTNEQAGTANYPAVTHHPVLERSHMLLCHLGRLPWKASYVLGQAQPLVHTRSLLCSTTAWPLGDLGKGEIKQCHCQCEVLHLSSFIHNRTPPLASKWGQPWRQLGQAD